MRILLAFLFLIAFSTSAFADKIIVKNDDGTTTSIDIGPSPLAPSVEPKAEPAKPQEKSVAPPRPVAADPAPATPVKPAKKPAAPKQDVKKETPVMKTPVKKPATPKKEKAPAPAPQKPQKKKAAPVAPAAKPAPDHAAPTPSAALPSQRLGPHMTPDDAIRIALDVAPPSRSVTASAVNYKGLHAYQVVFVTEDGERSVFVDRETGKIVK